METLQSILYDIRLLIEKIDDARYIAYISYKNYTGEYVRITDEDGFKDDKISRLLDIAIDMFDEIIENSSKIELTVMDELKKIAIPTEQTTKSGD